jgi:uncharacterized delta-60 repeat protein
MKFSLSRPKARGLPGVTALIVVGLGLCPLAVGASPRPGELDRSFAGGGVVRMDFDGGSFDEATDVAALRDGKTVVAGEALGGGAGGFGLARYTVEGALDATFDADGKVRTRFTPASTELAYALAVQPDGKYVVGGAVGIPGSGTASDFALARYNPDGTLDPTFDGDGKVVTNFVTSTDQAIAVALQSDGKVVAVGFSRMSSTSKFDVAVARYNPDGSLDTSFSADGKVTTPVLPGDDGAQAVAIQQDGKIVVAGGTPAVPSAGTVVRYLPDGSLDTTFGSGGIVAVSPGFVTDLALQAGRQDRAGRPVSGLQRDAHQLERHSRHDVRKRRNCVCPTVVGGRLLAARAAAGREDRRRGHDQTGSGARRLRGRTVHAERKS